jgi:hypothetical protein
VSPTYSLAPSPNPARSPRHGMHADPIRGFAVGANPTTAGGSVDPPRIGGEIPGAKTRAGRRGIP